MVTSDVENNLIKPTSKLLRPRTLLPAPSHPVQRFLQQLLGKFFITDQTHCETQRFGQVKSDQPIKLRGRDFRFDPDTGRIETQIGQTQFQRSRDDWRRG